MTSCLVLRYTQVCNALGASMIKLLLSKSEIGSCQASSAVITICNHYHFKKKKKKKNGMLASWT